MNNPVITTDLLNSSSFQESPVAKEFLEGTSKITGQVTLLLDVRKIPWEEGNTRGRDLGAARDLDISLGNQQALSVFEERDAAERSIFVSIELRHETNSGSETIVTVEAPSPSVIMPEESFPADSKVVLVAPETGLTHGYSLSIDPTETEIATRYMDHSCCVLNGLYEQSLQQHVAGRSLN